MTRRDQTASMAGGKRLSGIMEGETVPPGNSRKRSKTKKATLVAEEKRQKAIDLRRKGYSYREIAAEIGATHGYCYKLVSQALKRIREETNEIAEDARQLELDRLDKLWMHAYQAVEAGDIGAIDKAVKVMDRRSKLLGLDAPARHDITGTLISSPEWVALRGVIVTALEAFPEAQAAVINAIAAKAGENGGGTSP